VATSKPAAEGIDHRPSAGLTTNALWQGHRANSVSSFATIHKITTSFASVRSCTSTVAPVGSLVYDPTTVSLTVALGGSGNGTVVGNAEAGVLVGIPAVLTLDPS
jgi:hypothetical protein